MKKLLLAGVAAAGLIAGAGAVSAADLPSRTVAPMAPMVSAVPIFTWTGFYVGAQVGYAWGDDDNAFPVGSFVPGPVPGTFVPFEGGFGGDNDSFLAGVHAGYNFQIGSIVVGVEGDIEGLFGDDDDNDFNGVLYSQVSPGVFAPAAYAFSANTLDWQGSIRGRVGFAFDRALIYATGGFAFGGVSGGFSNGLIDNGDDTITGWTIGGGVEYAFTNNLTTRIEYRYTNFEGDDSVFNNVNFGGGDLDFHTVKVGLSYKF
jgi:outer membrane immunogenic protein